MIKILFFGDIVGRPGRAAVKRFLEENKESIRPDLVIGNTDNLSSGRGPTVKKCDEMIEMGLDILTCGDHIWDQKEIIEVLQKKDGKLLRPDNYPDICPGRGVACVDVKGKPVLIVNLIGRVFTTEGLNSPFVALDKILEENKEKTVIVDFHAEASSEKVALVQDFKGRISAVIGTHAHMQTADEKIYADHTAFLGDAGFCGPHDSVIGVEPALSIKRFRSGIPLQFELAEGPTQVNAVLLEIDEKTGRAVKIERIFEVYE